MKKYVESTCLWKCETCFYYFDDKCSSAIDCDYGESYRPDYDKLTIIEGEIVPEAHWEICCDGYYPYCSNCRHEPKNGEMTKHCPNCGAKMI